MSHIYSYSLILLLLLISCSTQKPAATGPDERSGTASSANGQVVSHDFEKTEKSGHDRHDTSLKSSVSVDDYRRAEELLNSNLQSKVLRSNIQPNWIDDHRFWYRTRTENGFRFYMADPANKERMPAFDHDKLAGTLKKLLEKEVSASELPFTTIHFLNDHTIRFEADKHLWDCNIQDYDCVRPDVPVRPDNSVMSPDLQWAAFIKDHNLWVRDMTNGEDFALTSIGEERYGFATNSQGWFRSDRPVLHWSPDSRKIATYRLDERDVAEMHLLKTAMDRPVLDSWPYALPGDTLVPMHERLILDVPGRKKIWLDTYPSHQRTSNCCGLERGDYWADISWNEDASKLAYVTTSRDYREVNLYIADTKTGEARHVYGETANTFFESNLTSRGIPNWRILFDRNQFVWFSRRDEWGHLYLHSLSSGEQLSRITSGNWNVVDVLHVDQEEGTIYFTAVGKETGRDPYLKHLYKVDIGKGYADAASGTEEMSINHPVLLSPQNANHVISASPSGRFFVDEYSTVTVPSVTVVRDDNGVEVMALENADITPLEKTPWVKPEPFTVKARDGKTDLYGLIYKPSHFDPSVTYPVVVNIYPGPQIGSVGTRSFSPARRGQPHALAELGFIVIHLDALGTPMRSKSFHTAWYGDMSDNGIEDQITAIRQLAGKYSWIDADRAGMYGHSGGGYATMSALLDYPGVFKAGVASAGNMDNRGYTFYWGEKYQGQRIATEDNDTFASQAIWKKAGRLQDHLLLSYGTMDSNVHPNTTLLLIDELIRENKDFDLIVMPNRGHGYANEAYHVRRTWDFFVRHLMQVEPPREFRIN